MYKKNLLLVVFFCLFASLPFLSMNLSAGHGGGHGGFGGGHGGYGSGHFDSGRHGNWNNWNNHGNWYGDRDYYYFDGGYGGYPNFYYDSGYPYDNYYYNNYPYYNDGIGVGVGGTGLYFNW